jgi:molybdate transport system substrate-binding protein
MLSRRLLLLASLLAACPGIAGAQQRDLQLTVSAAASLTDVLRELGKLFEDRHPNVQVRLNFGASGALLQQIANGAPVDVFVSADEETIERGVAQKLFAAETRSDVASNSLALITSSARRDLGSLRDLAGTSVQRIAIGKPVTVPAGRYAKQALEAAGLWTTLATRFVFADNVRQVLDYVSRGEVDAGFVYGTDALIMRDRVRVVAIVEGHLPIRYPAIVVADSRRPEIAAAFIDFLRSPQPRARFIAAGFRPPTE